MTGEVLIETRGLARSFGSLRAVEGVDLTVYRGEVFGFLGPNGAGKSTLIRMLVGLLAPSAGEATVCGFQIPKESEQLRPHVGYMTQRFSLYEDLSVQENLEFAAEIFGLRGPELGQRVASSLEEHELGERRSQRPATLSGGWKQRLALAVATIHRPKLLVLDEPTAGVDPDRRRNFWEKLFELAAQGTTLLVSTHYMDEAVRCHRLCMMMRGHPVAVGPPMALAEELEERVVQVQADSVEQAIAFLRARPAVQSVTQLGSRAHVLLGSGGPPARAAAVALEQELRQGGFTGLQVEAAEPNLEDVFVALTMGEDLGGSRP
jgi:ABC-2 type transport system ATP-binding protein